MNCSPPHVFSGPHPASVQPAGASPSHPDCPETVIVWDTHPPRRALIRGVLEGLGLRTEPVGELAALHGDRDLTRARIAIVALEGRPSPGDAALDAVRTLKQRLLTVISHAEGVDAWPIGARCRALLAGSSWLLDSGDTRFGDELSRLVAQTARAAADREAADAQVEEAMGRLGLVGRSEAMMAVFRQVLQVSPLSDLPVLITGETGTGKELMAHAIQQLDPKRRHGPFIALNCGALSPGLAESELFGHRRGAFTGAERQRPGLVRAAEGGVLFLDEIGELAVDLQVKLLRVLQERRVLGLGEDQEVSVSVRVVAATNRPLDQLVERGTFRADLFHRLSVLTLSIPPLRDRPADVEPLIAHMVKKHETLAQAGRVEISRDFVDAVRQIDLPGNARQLENLVRQALVNKAPDAPLTLRDLPAGIWLQLAERWEGRHPGVMEPAMAAPLLSSCLVDLVSANGWNLAQALQHCERVLLEAALHRKGGNQSQTARLLGLTPRSVYSKIRRHHLSR